MPQVVIRSWSCDQGLFNHPYRVFIFLDIFFSVFVFYDLLLYETIIVKFLLIKFILARRISSSSVEIPSFVNHRYG